MHTTARLALLKLDFIYAIPNPQSIARQKVNDNYNCKPTMET